MENESERRELEALRLAARAARAIEAINGHQKSLVQELSERRKRLRNLIAGIQQQESLGVGDEFHHFPVMVRWVAVGRCAAGSIRPL